MRIRCMTCAASGKKTFLPAFEYAGVKGVGELGFVYGSLAGSRCITAVPDIRRVTDWGSVPGIGTNLMNRETFFLPGRRAIVISSCRSVKFLAPKIRRHCRQCWLRVSTLTMIADVPKLLQR